MQLPPTMLQEGLLRNMLHDFLLGATLYNEMHIFFFILMHSKVIGAIVSAQNVLHLLSLKQIPSVSVPVLSKQMSFNFPQTLIR